MTTTDREEPRRPRGRPSVYTQEVAEEICSRLATGESLRSICRTAGMPDEAVVRGWVLDDREGFASRYTRARDLGLDAMADELLDVADEQVGVTESGSTDTGAVNRNRLRVDTRKWYLSKLAPKRYGDKLDVNHGGQVSYLLEVPSEAASPEEWEGSQ